MLMSLEVREGCTSILSTWHPLKYVVGLGPLQGCWGILENVASEARTTGSSWQGLLAVHQLQKEPSKKNKKDRNPEPRALNPEPFLGCSLNASSSLRRFRCADSCGGAGLGFACLELSSRVGNL